MATSSKFIMTQQISNKVNGINHDRKRKTKQKGKALQLRAWQNKSGRTVRRELPEPRSIHGLVRRQLHRGPVAKRPLLARHRRTGSASACSRPPPRTYQLASSSRLIIYRLIFHLIYLLFEKAAAVRLPLFPFKKLANLKKTSYLCPHDNRITHKKEICRRYHD